MMTVGTEELTTAWLDRPVLDLTGFGGVSLGAAAARAGDVGAGTDSQGDERRELVVISEGVGDVRRLLDDLASVSGSARRLKAVVIPSDVDGVAALGEVLGRYRDLDALHVVSHGQQGGIVLGGAVLSVGTVGGYAESIREWSTALKPGADILLYGCDVAAGDAGRRLVDSVRTLTGADIAASEDKTGSSAAGGNWTLEYTRGRIDTEIAFSSSLQSSWNDVLYTETYPAGSYVIDMGQATATVGNSLKPYGLVYDMVTNLKVPVDWAINSAKDKFTFQAGGVNDVDFTATITTGTKTYRGGPFVIDAGFDSPALRTALNAWKAQGVVIDTLAAPLTTDVYGQVTSFPKAVLDLQNGQVAIPYYQNAGVPSTSYRLGNPTDLNSCSDVYILPHADPQNWTAAWKTALYNFVTDDTLKGGLWAGCHAVSALENLTTVSVVGGTQKLNFLSNDLVPWGSHSAGTPPYTYNTAAANDPVMQIMGQMDAATQNGSEQIFVPTSAQWRSTTTVAVYDPDHPQNPSGGTSPTNKSAVVAYGNAYGDPTNGFVTYAASHSLAKAAGSANIAAQRTFFNFILTQGIGKAPVAAVTTPTIVPGQVSTITASLGGGSGSYSYQWLSTNGGIFSKPAGSWRVGDPPLTTSYKMTQSSDTIRLLVTDSCGRQSIWYDSITETPPVIDLDGNDSSGATGNDFLGYFEGGGVPTRAADSDVLITDNGATISSGEIKLTNRPDGLNETLLIDDVLAGTYGIFVESNGAGGFLLSGTATLAQYQAVVGTLQYVNQATSPNTTARIIHVTVNDGISDSNTAVSRLEYPGGVVLTKTKALYLSSPSQGLDRIDPVATNDTTTATVSVTPVANDTSTGMVAYTNSDAKNLLSAPWSGTAFGTATTVTTSGGSYTVMAGASSPKKDERIVVGVTSDRTAQVSGAVWNGSAWGPISVSIGGTATQNLGDPSQKQWWGAGVAYEQTTGRGLLVWNANPQLMYSVWDGTSWSAAATIGNGTGTGVYTGTEPRQIRLKSNPKSGSNEIVMVVTDVGEVDRALVWNGSSWGNQVQLDSDTGHNFTDLNVAFERTSGRAMVVGASGTSGDIAYRLWDGSSWSSSATLADAGGDASGYAQWTSLDSDPNSNKIVLGVQTSGKDSWMNVWSGSAWGTSTMGVKDGIDNTSNLEIAVAFESKSGDALAVYQNNDTTELQYKTFQSGAWSTATNFGSFSGKVSRAVTLSANPYSDQLMLLVNDDAKILRSALWNGSSMGSFTQVEANTNTTSGQPFVYLWDRYVTGSATVSTTFTQAAPMLTPFVVPASANVTTTAYIKVTSGTLPATPKLGVLLSHGDSPIANVVSSPTVTNLGGGDYKLVWTGQASSEVTIPVGDAFSLTLTSYETGYSYDVLYDSSTYPSKVEVDTTTAISVPSVGVFDEAYPGGSALTTVDVGQPVRIRFTVSDPFGASDITSADLVITDSSNTTLVSTQLSGAHVVATTAATKTYEYTWTPVTLDTFTAAISANEGTEGVTGTGQVSFTTDASPDLVVTKSDGGTSVSPNSVVAYTISYSNAGARGATGVVITETVPDGSTFDAAGSTAGWSRYGTNQYRYTVGSLAAGASGTVQFAVRLSSEIPGDLEELFNTVTIDDDETNGEDADPSNNTRIDTTPVLASPDLTIVKTDGGVSTAAGYVVLYQITYSNTGNQLASNVYLEEQLPANTTFNDTYSSEGWDDVSGGAFVLLVGDLAVGETRTAIFAVTVDASLPGGVTQISNTVSVQDDGGGGSDSNPADNTSTDTTPIVANPTVADLQVTKTNNKTSVAPGEVVTYVITVTNAGPNGVTGAYFTDVVPSAITGMSYTTSVSGGASFSPASGGSNAIMGSLNLPANASITYTVTGTLDADATGTLENLANVLPPGGIVDPNTGDNWAIDTDPIVPVSDLSLDKTYTYSDLDGSGSLTPGDEIEFTVTVTNAGPDAAENVSVLDQLPNGYLYVTDDAASSGGTYSAGSGLWTIGTLDATPGSNTAVLRVTAIVYDGGTYTNVARVWTSDSSDPDSTPGDDVTSEDDYESVTPSVQLAADLNLTKNMALTSDLDSNGVMSIGDRVTFTLNVMNAGPSQATGVHVQDLLPAGYTYVSSSVTSGAGTYNNVSGDWNVGSIEVLSTATLTIVATIVGNQSVSAYLNYAEVSASGTFDPDSTPGTGSLSEDDEDSVTPPIADLSLLKRVEFASDGDADATETVTVGDSVSFTILVTNSGPDYARGVKVRDQLPNGYTYVNDDGLGSYVSTTGLWTIGSIAPQSTVALTITATVNATGAGVSFANIAEVSSSERFDPDSKPDNGATEDDRSSVTLVPGGTATAPVAVNDSSLGNPAGPVTLDVVFNDTDVNLNLDPGSVDLDPSTTGTQTTRTVSGEGTWVVDTRGNVTFTPQSGYTLDPTPITYTVKDLGGLVSNAATITIDYVPVASNDSSSGNNAGTAVTVQVLANDTAGDTAVPSTVRIVGTPAPGRSLVVPGEGTWSVNTTTGAITFTPEAGYAGDPTPIQYTVQDNDGNTSNAATVSIDYVQSPPVAVNDSSLGNAAGPVSLTVTTNDTDPNGDLDVDTVDLDPNTSGRQTTFVVSGEGTWTVDNAGQVTFTPQVGFTQDPTPISYTVSDEVGLVSNAATITIDFVPVATSDSSTGNTPGAAVTVSVLANDTSGDTVVPATVKIVGTTNPGDSLVVPGEGTWSVDVTTGSITFTPLAGFKGDPATIQYTVQDDDGNTSNVADVTVDYLPVATNDSSTGNTPGAAVTVSVLANDTTGDTVVPSTVKIVGTANPGDSLVVPGQGTWSVNATTGAITFTPQSGFTGDPTPVSYTVKDNDGNTSNAATVTIDYVPIATNDLSTGNTVGTAVTVNVLSNDTTGDSVVPSTVKIVGTTNPGDSLVVPGEGTWSVNGTTGAITFTPQSGFTGDPTPISYTVKDNDGNTSSSATVTVRYGTASQSAPVAVNDASLGNTPGPVSLTVTTNDTDTDGDLDASTVDLDPATPGRQSTYVVSGEGTWTVDATGSVTFTPQTGFSTDPTPITYKVSDTTGLDSNAATITIDYVPVATNDSSTGNTLGTAVTVNVLANDTTGDTVVPTTVKIVGTTNAGDSLVVPGEGTWSVNATTGAITFTPVAGYTGDPTPISYTVLDGDGNASNAATVTIDYLQSPPVAVDDSSLGNPAGPVSLNVTTNDTDPDGDLDAGTVDLDPNTSGRQTTYVVSGEGTWTVDSAGSVTFTPQAGFTNDPTPITYKVRDVTGLLSNAATITIDYVPVATNDSSTGNTPGTAVTVSVLSNDTTGDTVVPSTVKIVGTTNPGDSLVVPGEGTWSVNTTTGAITFTPQAGFSGEPTAIQYTVEDNQGNTSNVATVTVNYDYRPVAVNDSLTNVRPGPASLRVVTNDSDPDGDTLLDVTCIDLDPATTGQQSSLVVPGEGTWRVEALGSVAFYPQAGFSLDPTPISYTVCNTSGVKSNVATITLDYGPWASNDSSLNNSPGTAVTLDVSINDVRGDTVDPTTVQILGTANPGAPLTVPGQGTWTINSTTGAITFTPQAGFTGDPSPIRYTIRDYDGNSSNLAIVTVTYLKPSCSGFPLTLVVDDLSTPAIDHIIVDGSPVGTPTSVGSSTRIDDSSESQGQVGFSGSTAKFSFVKVQALSKPFLSSTAPDIQITASFRSSASGQIAIRATDGCYGVTSGNAQQLISPFGGTTNGRVVFRETVDWLNRPFGQSGATTRTNTFTRPNAGAFSAQPSVAFTPTSAWVSLTKQINVTHSRANQLTTLTAGGKILPLVAAAILPSSVRLSPVPWMGMNMVRWPIVSERVAVRSPMAAPVATQQTLFAVQAAEALISSPGNRVAAIDEAMRDWDGSLGDGSGFGS